MSLSTVKEYLKPFGLDQNIMELKQSSATVIEAANALGVEEDQIAKSLTFLIDEKPILIVVSGNSRIDNHKYKETFQKKASMIPFEEVENYVGHPAGGVCPFALKDGVSVYLDVSLKKYEIVYPAAGSKNSAVKLKLDELEKASKFKIWVDVCK